ncbi:hypothetical protein [Solirubrobacter soli]|uniref:hypothetical protein n=1 Tax=Solirubrobacter soli TaxID=363832 RepID=UPI0005659FDD|nr:hypothetical protein [Solirubrobacter soli]
MRDEIVAHPERLERAHLCLETPELELLDAERESLISALGTASAAVARFRSELLRAPTHVRGSSTWKACKESLVAVQRIGDEVRDTAVERLLDRLPRPRSGVTRLLAPFDARRDEYSRLEVQYKTARESVTSSESLLALIRICDRLGVLEEEIKRSAVPEEHRRQWEDLLAGRLTLDGLDPDFHTWLKREGHHARIGLTYR